MKRQTGQMNITPCLSSVIAENGPCRVLQSRKRNIVSTREQKHSLMQRGGQYNSCHHIAMPGPRYARSYRERIVSAMRNLQISGTGSLFHQWFKESELYCLLSFTS